MNSSMISLPAYAKINLTLEVLARRPDGYHDISTVLQTISMADTLTFEPDSILDFQCNVSELRTHDNLVVKAAHLLRAVTGTNKGAIIRLTKDVPATAGLGSGSSDAAAALIGLNRLWQLNLPLQRLAELAATLGSDVSFFIYGGTALAEGRGERVTPLPSLPQLWLVLLEPAIEAVPGKTGKLYSQLTSANFTSGQYTRKLIDALSNSQKIEDAILFNVFEQVAFNFFPRLNTYRSNIVKAGAANVHLAGSGPCLFALVPDQAQGEMMRKRLENEGQKAYLVHTINQIIS